MLLQMDVWRLTQTLEDILKSTHTVYHISINKYEENTLKRGNWEEVSYCLATKMFLQTNLSKLEDYKKGTEAQREAVTHSTYWKDTLIMDEHTSSSEWSF